MRLGLAHRLAAIVAGGAGTDALAVVVDGLQPSGRGVAAFAGVARARMIGRFAGCH